MALEILTLGEGQLSGSADSQIYAVPASKAAIVKSIRLVNTDTVTLTVNLFYRKSGGTSRRIIPKNLSLAPGAAYVDDSEITMGASDTIRGDASAGTKIDYVLSGIQRDA